LRFVQTRLVEEPYFRVWAVAPTRDLFRPTPVRLQVADS
jgi:hypothetical protein